jgi:hypothetical protein
LAGLEATQPHLQETLLAAMGNVELKRLLDTRYLDLDGDATPWSHAVPVEPSRAAKVHQAVFLAAPPTIRSFARACEKYCLCA